jgi:hypothetical protein
MNANSQLEYSGGSSYSLQAQTPQRIVSFQGEAGQVERMCHKCSHDRGRMGGQLFN